ncbi:MAG: hypothetical protein LBC97_16215 [Bifidobacteriaceae bacterium]|jgi:hypothetical protein|nr:hypothetical protein [Bifidobacteriaceae bacterium]
MRLDLTAREAHWFWDELETNAISFTPGEGADWSWFTFQRGVADDPEYPDMNTVHVELDDQSQGGYYDLAGVLFLPDRIEIAFAKDQLFLDRYRTACILLPEPVDRRIVDFFANGLFLGNRISYGSEFPENDRVEQTEFPHMIDDQEV